MNRRTAADHPFPTLPLPPPSYTPHPPPSHVHGVVHAADNRRRRQLLAEQLGVDRPLLGRLHGRAERRGRRVAGGLQHRWRQHAVHDREEKRPPAERGPAARVRAEGWCAADRPVMLRDSQAAQCAKSHPPLSFSGGGLTPRKARGVRACDRLVLRVCADSLPGRSRHNPSRNAEPESLLLPSH